MSIKEILQNNKIKGIISIIAAIVMYFTPDNIDTIIELILIALGLNVLTLSKKD